ncbi:AraC family transcriptional regulator [Pseudomonas phoenicis]|uniref:AraC family transcriptional regulator n=1 Tax=unclassified Pseudomonas TaxID=196821 RepID=UPI0039A05911
MQGRAALRLGDLSVGLVQPLADALRELGYDPEPLLQRYGLDAARLAQVGARLSIPRYMHLGHAAIAMCGDPGLGLCMGRHSRLAHAGLAGVTAGQAPTVRAAAQALLRFEPLYASNYRGRCSFEEDAHGAWLNFYSISPYNAYNRFVVDSLLSGWLTQLSGVANRPLRAERLHIEFPAPAEAERYQALCEHPVQFGGEANRLRLGRVALDVRNPVHCPGTWQHLLQLCEAELDQLTRVRSLRERIIHLLGPQLSGGREPNLEDVAQRMGLPSWTLRRQLAEEGTGFRELLNGMRRDLAETYIRDTVLSFGEVAYVLGFTSAEAFQRAFKRWTGVTPGSYRRQQRRLNQSSVASSTPSDPSASKAWASSNSS